MRPFLGGKLLSTLKSLKSSIEKDLIQIELTDIRDFTTDRHNSADDTPYGGGPGMVMKCEPVFAAVESLQDRNSLERVILLSPRGRPVGP